MSQEHFVCPGLPCLPALALCIQPAGLSPAEEDYQAIHGGKYLIEVAHELERIIDHSTNIAERVICAVIGELLDLNTGTEPRVR
jgi:hypothetical protein